MAQLAQLGTTTTMKQRTLRRATLIGAELVMAVSIGMAGLISLHGTASADTGHLTYCQWDNTWSSTSHECTQQQQLKHRVNPGGNATSGQGGEGGD